MVLLPCPVFGVEIPANFQLNSLEKTEAESSLEQLTSVSQLSDIQPTDWAYEALKNLVERYGCIAGYPDGTFGGNRVLTRYEFAAGLNACLENITQIITKNNPNFARKEDLENIRKLQQEFASELATIAGKINSLDTRSRDLELTQFSTTTKLNGELLTYFADAFGAEASEANDTTFQYRLRLYLNTSFTGKDRLLTILQARNLTPFNVPNGSNDETRLSAFGDSEGKIQLNRLEYRFPLGDKLDIYVEANSIDPTLILDPINPYFIDPAYGSVSNFAQINPTFVVIDNSAGLGLQYRLNQNIILDAGYLGETGSFNNPTKGIFGGGFSTYGQVAFYPSDTFRFALSYVHSYSPEFGVDTLAGSLASKVIIGRPVVSNSYGLQASYLVTPRFAIGGWVGYTAARAISVGDANILNGVVHFAFPDLGKEGNLGGVLVGMQPRLMSSDPLLGSRLFPDEPTRTSDKDIGFHIEAFYRHNLTDNISITPGFFWLTAPNHDAGNPDVFVGVLRTNFLF